jgi:arylsulfatase A-like enzyme
MKTRNAELGTRNWSALVLLLLSSAFPVPSSTFAADSRPNILLVISDDQSFPYCSAYRDPVTATPAFDRIARYGVLFDNAFANAPSSCPSRAALLTGQDIWRLGQGAVDWSTLPAKFPVYPELLEKAGYQVGYSGKGWPDMDRPELLGDRKRNPAGLKYPSFDEFFRGWKRDKPFCFWLGSRLPHRPYKLDSGLDSGKTLQSVVAPHYLPDQMPVRGDLLDYCTAIEQFDRELEHALRLLEDAELDDNTLIIVTSDNGYAFPRGKGTLYEYGIHVPLAIQWRSQIVGGRTIHDFVTLKDLCPTFLDVGGVQTPHGVTGRSLLPMLLSENEGYIEQSRETVIAASERHAWSRPGGLGYPRRTIRTEEWVYIMNLEPDRWPAGDPDPQFNWTGSPRKGGAKPEGFGDIDPSPTKSYLLANEHRRPVEYKRLTGKLPAEELYNFRYDRFELKNVAGDPKYAAIKSQLREQLIEYCRKTGDPRFTGGGGPVVFDSYPYYGPKSPADTPSK